MQRDESDRTVPDAGLVRPAVDFHLADQPDVVVVVVVVAAVVQERPGARLADAARFASRLRRQRLLPRYEYVLAFDETCITET